ncbi:MAG: ferritin-like domain-containing protein [Alphaproteobacteria bacterium]
MTIYEKALQALQAADPEQKRLNTQALARDWANACDLGEPPVYLPSHPARPELPALVPQSQLPRRRLGTVAGRCALLHAVAHIEFNAIDLALDMLCRFGQDLTLPQDQRQNFADDWISVAADEARHFGLLCERLKELGQNYGDFPAHNGLWEAALATRHDIAARLAIAPMVLEARGLDVTPAMIKKFSNVGDNQSAEILTIIYNDEIGHVAKGAKWFHLVAKIRKHTPETYFKSLIKAHFTGHIKPPFNEIARTLAGIPASYYASTL